MIFIDCPKICVCLNPRKRQILSYTIKSFLDIINNKVYYNFDFVFAAHICIITMHLTNISIFRKQKLYSWSWLFLKVLCVPEKCYDLFSTHVKKECVYEKAFALYS